MITPPADDETERRTGLLEARKIYQKYSPSVAFVSTRSAGVENIGSAFHVGEGVFLTARHVVEGREILAVSTTTGCYVADPDGLVTIDGRTGRFSSRGPFKGRVTRGPLFHPDDNVDVAALVVEGVDCAPIPLGGYLDDWINDEEFVLRQAVVLGFPPIPLSERPVLVANRAEINAVVDLYIGKHPRFILSSTARGGFSGGPCLIEFGGVLGLVTESLLHGDMPVEGGYFSVLPVEPLYECLAHHGVLPRAQVEGFGGFWQEVSARRHPPEDAGT